MAPGARTHAQHCMHAILDQHSHRAVPWRRLRAHANSLCALMLFGVAGCTGVPATSSTPDSSVSRNRSHSSSSSSSICPDDYFRWTASDLSGMKPKKSSVIGVIGGSDIPWFGLVEAANAAKHTCKVWWMEPLQPDCYTGDWTLLVDARNKTPLTSTIPFGSIFFESNGVFKFQKASNSITGKFTGDLWSTLMQRFRESKIERQ